VNRVAQEGEEKEGRLATEAPRLRRGRRRHGGKEVKREKKERGKEERKRKERGKRARKFEGHAPA
jgi:hypothetical protein